MGPGLIVEAELANNIIANTLDKVIRIRRELEVALGIAEQLSACLHGDGDQNTELVAKINKATLEIKGAVQGLQTTVNQSKE